MFGRATITLGIGPHSSLKTVACVIGSQYSWRRASVALADQGTTVEQHVLIDSELFAVCPNFERRNNIVDCYNSPAWHR